MESGVVKTPTFARGTHSEPPKGRTHKSRQSASTLHPAVSPSRTSDTATTSPETTPEKGSKTRRKRRIRKPKVERTATEALTRSEEKTTTLETPPELSVPSEDTRVAEAASTIKGRGGESKDALVAKKALPEAMTMEIEYPSFQTTAILEFEPDFPQLPAPQSPESHVSVISPTEEPSGSTSASQEQYRDETPKPDPPKPKGRRNRFFRRYQRFNPPKHKPKPPPKIPADEGARPRLVLLFEQYGVQFANDKRPYLQFTALAAAAKERDSEADVDELRRQFVKTLKWDGEHSWPGHQIVISPIDLYFAGKDDGKIKTFRYDPTNEASVEFLRLAMQARWIKEIPQWDTTHWDDSLEKFEKIWSKQVAKEERKKFREACFFEFDNVTPLSR